jgi:hypothetical protein
MDGQEVGFGEMFVYDPAQAKDTPGDVMSGQTPPLHPMCRCTTWIDVTIESVEDAFAAGPLSFDPVRVDVSRFGREGWTTSRSTTPPMRMLPRTLPRTLSGAPSSTPSGASSSRRSASSRETGLDSPSTPTPEQQARIARIDSDMAAVRADAEAHAQAVERYNAARGGSIEERAAARDLERTREASTRMGELTREKAELLFREETTVDANASRWARVPEPERALRTSTTSADAGPAVRNADLPDFQKLRDRYVVADTPTLQMNRAARGEIEWTPSLKRRWNEALKLTDGVTTQDAIVSRTMALTPDEAMALRPGTVWESKGFQSTQELTVSRYDRTRDVVGTINVEVLVRVPAGTHAADLGYGEIVLRPGASRVVSARMVDGTLRVVVEVI